MEAKLYEASLVGDVDAMHALLRQDPLILHRPAATCHQDTLLHVAALRGHLGFVKALLDLKPRLASELDGSGRSALHLAASEGHADVISELLRVGDECCVVEDQYGRVPVHLAVVKGRVEAVRELVRARPEAVRARVDRGETVFHLCVKSYRLEVLRFLVEFVEGWDDDDEVVGAGDDDGNTILHLATILKQMETIKYLLSTRSGQEMARTKNLAGLTALDALELSPRDLKSVEIRDFLLQSNLVPRSHKPKPTTSSNTTTTTTTTTSNPPKNKSKLKKLWRMYRRSDTNWIEESRGNLMVVATLTAAMAFQAGTSPPWSKNDLSDPSKESDVFTKSHEKFLVYNTISFVASLTIILLTVSGVPLRNKFSLWLLMVSVCLTVTFTALTYLESLDIITPDSDWDKVDQTYNAALYTCIGVFVFVFAVYSVRILIWVVVKVHEYVSRKYLEVKGVNKEVGMVGV